MKVARDFNFNDMLEKAKVNCIPPSNCPIAKDKININIRSIKFNDLITYAIKNEEVIVCGLKVADPFRAVMINKDVFIEKKRIPAAIEEKMAAVIKELKNNLSSANKKLNDQIYSDDLVEELRKVTSLAERGDSANERESKLVVERGDSTTDKIKDYSRVNVRECGYKSAFFIMEIITSLLVNRRI